MKRSPIVLLGVCAVLFLALLGWGLATGADEVMGIVAAKGAASITADDQPGAKTSVVIAEVVAPADAFVVVHTSMDGKPGMRLGFTPVHKGVNRDVVVKLDAASELTPELLAAVHMDRGTPGKLDYNMKTIEHSSDRPFYVEGKEVATAFKVR